MTGSISRWNRTAPLLAVALALASSSGGETGDSHASPDELRALEADLKRGLPIWVREYHRKLEYLDVPKIIREAKVRLRRGDSREAIFVWIGEERARSDYSFAPRGAAHDASVLYRLPYPLKIPGAVVAGVGDAYHKENQRYSFDFMMPIGTPILAARAGMVRRVIDGFGPGGREDQYRSKGNSVRVLHSDGTFATYHHLTEGIPVREGQAVRRGEPIGACGDSGWSRGPHLHFSVGKLDRNGEAVSIPIRFGLRGLGAFVPQSANYYGRPPKPTLELRISVDGKPIDLSQPLEIRAGASVQLSVEAISPSGSVRDVTRHAATEYASMTLWSVDVKRGGYVIAQPAYRFDRGEIDRVDGAVSVFYVNRARREVGLAMLKIRVLHDPPRPAAGGP